MKNVLIALVAFSCLFLAGCPLQTATPIDGPAVPAPSWMVGKWTSIKSNGSLGTAYDVTAGSANGLLIITSLDSTSSQKPAQLTKLNGTLYLSVYDKGEEALDEGYYHYAIEHNNGKEMSLIPLKEHGVASTANGVNLALYITTNAKTGDHLNKAETEHFRKQ